MPPISPHLFLRSERLPNDCNGLLALKAEKSVELKHNPSVHSEPNAGHHYVERKEEWKCVEELLSCLGGSLDELKQIEIEKKKIFTLEYATISGAGKSRLVMHQFGQKKFKDIPMSLVGLNFSGGTGGGSDTDSVIETILDGGVDVAMSRLLLSRGFFGVHPQMKIFNHDVPLPDPSLPTVHVVIEALFQDRFPADPVCQGLLVVHLDELWQLKKQMHARLRRNPNIMAGECKPMVDGLVKRFISILLEYSFENYVMGRYILPVVSHTCPDNDLLENRKHDQTLYSPTGLLLFPFSVEQSIELLRCRRAELSQPSRKRNLDGEEISEEWEEINWDGLKSIVALAGGHPSLILNCFPALLQPEGVSVQTTSMGSMVSDLMTNNRVRSFGQTVAQLAREAKQAKQEKDKKAIEEFLTDCLLCRVVPAEKHEEILRRGAGWFRPTCDEHTGERISTHGLVSTPFPIMVLLMRACHSFKEIGGALDPRKKDYAPTKAMEFVSALAVLLRRMGSVGLWKTFTTVKAFEAVQAESKNFFSVWPISNQAVVDFGGKLGEWKILGQTKMQEPGKEHTTQSLAEVMEMAWKIGHKVKTKPKPLAGKVHAYWVSSQKAQSQKTLQCLVHAFRVAMSGTITKKEAERRLNEEAEEMEVAEGMVEEKRKKAVDVRLFIGLLNRMTPDNNYKFTYIGPNCAKQDDSILPLRDLLPEGIFAGWA